MFYVPVDRNPRPSPELRSHPLATDIRANFAKLAEAKAQRGREAGRETWDRHMLEDASPPTLGGGGPLFIRLPSNGWRE